MAGLHIALHLPENIIEKYLTEGPLDKVLSDHLKKTVDYKAVKPLFINDILRQRLERFFGLNFDNPIDLIKVIEKYSVIRVNDTDITLPPALVSRLRSRHFDTTKTFEQFLSDLIIKSLEEFTGVR